jgi:SAM-dependent methyltransferase
MPRSKKAKESKRKDDSPYREDLSFIHDAGFGHLARGGGEVLLAQKPVERSMTKRAVDLGCGSGILSELLSQAGYEVVGFDLSAAMIERSRSRVPSGLFRQESILDAEIPRCAVVAAVGEIVNYLFDSTHSLVRLTNMFRRVAAALEPGGVFLVDGAAPGRGQKPGGYQGFREGPDWFCAFHAVEEQATPILTRTITTFVQQGNGYRRDHEVHRLRLLEPRWVKDQLTSAGLRVRRLPKFGETRFPKGYFSFLAVKPTTNRSVRPSSE